MRKEAESGAVGQEISPPPVKVFYHRDPVRVRQLEGPLNFWEHLVFQNRGTKLFGEENLWRICELQAAGTKLIITPNHLSLLDHYYLRAFLNHYGFRDIWDNLVFVGRRSLFKNPLFRLFLPLADIIAVVSPREIKEIRKIKDPQECRRKLAEAFLINQAAKLEIDKALEGRKPVVIYGEGQMGRTGSLTRIDSHAAALAKSADFMVAFGIFGTDNVLPTDFHQKLAKSPKDALPRPWSPVTLTVGPPYPIPKEVNGLELSELVGCQIAACLPPEKRGVYAR